MIQVNGLVAHYTDYMADVIQATNISRITNHDVSTEAI